MSCPCSCHNGLYYSCDVSGGCGSVYHKEKPQEAQPEPEPVEKPQDRCVTHRPPAEGKSWRRADPGYLTCQECASRLHKWLTVQESTEERPESILGLYNLLDANPSVTGDGRRAPGFGSRPPGSVHVMAMRDRRSNSMWKPDGPAYIWDPETKAYVDKKDGWKGSDGKMYPELGGNVSILFRVSSMAQLVAEEREMTKPAETLEDCCEFLDRNLDWICRQEMVEEFFHDVRKLQRQLDSITGEPGPKPIAKCIHILDSGEDCNTPIFMPAGLPPRAPDEPISDLPALICPACGADYKGAAIARLKLENERREKEEKKRAS